MAQTLYATFPDPSLAEKAAGALLDHGARNEDISIISREYQNGENTGADVDNTRRDYTAHSATLDERRTYTNAATADVDAAGGAAARGTQSFGDRVAEAGDNTMATMTGAVGADNAAQNYRAAADRRAEDAGFRADQSRTDYDTAGGVTTSTTDPYEVPVNRMGSPAEDVGAARSGFANPPATAVDVDRPVFTGDRAVGTSDRDYATDSDYAADRDYTADRDGNTTVIDHRTGAGDPAERSAKEGLSTTTGGDAAAGAAKGAGWGLGLGIIAGLASIAIPGFGLVVGGGALATAIGAMAATTVAGAIAGGVYGYLVDQGVPEHIATTYNEAYQRGHAILSIALPSGDLDELSAREILIKYGAENVNDYATAGRMAA